jgi:hypothetical protein
MAQQLSGTLSGRRAFFLAPAMVDRQDRMAGLQNSVDASTPNAERLSDLGSAEALGFHLAHPGRVY